MYSLETTTVTRSVNYYSNLMLLAKLKNEQKNKKTIGLHTEPLIREKDVALCIGKLCLHVVQINTGLLWNYISLCQWGFGPGMHTRMSAFTMETQHLGEGPHEQLNGNCINT